MVSRKKQDLCFILTVKQDGSAIFEAQSEDSYTDELFQKWTNKGYLEVTREFGNLSVGNSLRYKTSKSFRYTIATFRRIKDNVSEAFEATKIETETDKNFHIETSDNQSAWDFFPTMPDNRS